jgi:transposase
VARADLEIRPIFHFKEDPIELHLLICFLTLVISKHVEIKTGTSIKRFITEAKKGADAKMLNKLTRKEVIIKVKLTESAEML